MGEAVARRCSVKRVFLEISQNSRKNICARVSFPVKICQKKRLWQRCFPVNFMKTLRTYFLTEHRQWLLLQYQISNQTCISLIWQMLLAFLVVFISIKQQ